jgi:DNA polymerase V
MLDELLPQDDQPRTLFDEPRKSPTLMAALDAVNARFGKKTMVLASEGTARTWQLRANHRSPRYTTRISDLPVVR